MAKHARLVALLQHCMRADDVEVFARTWQSVTMMLARNIEATSVSRSSELLIDPRPQQEWAAETAEEAAASRSALPTTPQGAVDYSQGCRRMAIAVMVAIAQHSHEDWGPLLLLRSSGVPELLSEPSNLFGDPVVDQLKSEARRLICHSRCELRDAALTPMVERMRDIALGRRAAAAAAAAGSSRATATAKVKTGGAR